MSQRQTTGKNKLVLLSEILSLIKYYATVAAAASTSTVYTQDVLLQQCRRKFCKQVASIAFCSIELW